MFMPDDHPASAIGAYGNPWVHSPNIDSLARDGALFNNAFVTTSLCAPSRASIMTGLYAHSHLVCANRITPRLEEVALSKDFVTFPEIMQAHGYETAFIGKSHFRPYLRDRGFDYYFGFEGHGRYRDPVVAEAESRSGPYVDREYPGHLTDVLTDHALKFIRRPHDKPFILFVWYKAPHTPLDPPDRFARMYADHDFQPPSTWDADLSGRPDWVANGGVRDGSRDDLAKWRDNQRKIYQLLAGVDESVGKVLQALDELGIAERTAVIHTSDNGRFMGELGMADKRLMYEPSIKVPFVMRYPDMIRSGTTVDSMMLNIDVAPTLLELAGAPVPDHMQGLSFLGPLRGDTASWREDWLYEYYEFPKLGFIPPFRGVRTDRYTYIHWYSRWPQREELYDLAEDPRQLQDLSDDPAHADTLAQMRDRLRRLRHESDDPDIWKN
jgi:arylsulfatase A-like enzyme